MREKESESRIRNGIRNREHSVEHLEHLLEKFSGAESMWRLIGTQLKMKIERMITRMVLGICGRSMELMNALIWKGELNECR